MSDPFRSDAEALREKLRRAEEELAELRAEHAQLQGIVPFRPSPPRRAVVIATLASAAGSIGVTWMTCETENKKEFDRAKLEWAERSGRQVTDLEAQARISDRALASAQKELATCQNTLPWGRPDGPLEVDEKPSLREVDKAAIAAALGNAKISSCWQNDYGPAHITTTFETDGRASSARVDSPIVTDAEQKCVTAGFKGVHVPPFAGSPLEVGKTFPANRAK